MYELLSRRCRDLWRRLHGNFVGGAAHTRIPHNSGLAYEYVPQPRSNPSLWRNLILRVAEFEMLHRYHSIALLAYIISRINLQSSSFCMGKISSVRGHQVLSSFQNSQSNPCIIDMRAMRCCNLLVGNHLYRSY